MAPLADKRRWQERIRLIFNEKIRRDQYRDLATRRLLLLKDAITETTIRMSSESQIDVAREVEDKIGWTMVCIGQWRKLTWPR